MSGRDDDDTRHEDAEERQLGGRRTQATKKELQVFARRLHKAMIPKGLSNSDLARALWEETKDNKGYMVAKNRYRIALYLRCEAFPSLPVFQKMTEVLEVQPEYLAPHLFSQGDDDGDDPSQTRFSMELVPGRPDLVHLQLSAVLPLATAAKISQLFSDVRGAAATNTIAVPGVDTDLEDDDQ